jgi:hypothetical protein
VYRDELDHEREALKNEWTDGSCNQFRACASETVK